MTPDGQRPTPYKRYYDIACYVATQTVFSFTVAPFVLLELNASLLVWRRVYFYAIVLVGASMAFFASPAKPLLAQKLKARGRPPMPRTESYDTKPILGMPTDPEIEIQDAIREIKQEVEARRRQGSTVAMPAGDDLTNAVLSKVGREKST